MPDLSLFRNWELAIDFAAWAVTLVGLVLGAWLCAVLLEGKKR